MANEKERQTIILVASILGDILADNAHLFVGGEEHVIKQIGQLNSAVATLTRPTGGYRSPYDTSRR